MILLRSMKLIFLSLALVALGGLVMTYLSYKKQVDGLCFRGDMQGNRHVASVVREYDAKKILEQKHLQGGSQKLDKTPLLAFSKGQKNRELRLLNVSMCQLNKMSEETDRHLRISVKAYDSLKSHEQGTDSLADTLRNNTLLALEESIKNISQRNKISSDYQQILQDNIRMLDL